MPVMNIKFEEPAWWMEDFQERINDDRLIWLGNDAPPIGITGLSGGMESGKPSVAIRFDLPDGRTVIAETSLALFLTAADALKARYGDPRT